MDLIQHRFAAMGGQNEIQLYVQVDAQGRQACLAAAAEVLRIEQKYSRYRPDSVISLINAAAGLAPVLLDAETSALLAYCDACFNASDGLFDVTSGVLRGAWDFSVQNDQLDAAPRRVPPTAELSVLLDRVGWRKVMRQDQRLALPAGMALDFGGIGKEYAADRACAVLLSAGVRHGLVDLGGDIRVLGPQPTPGTRWSDGQALDTQPWLVGIAHPRRAGQTLCTVAMDHGALATSGDYERYFEMDGRRYCHILNPLTGMPCEYWQSVSVIAPVCMAAGSACTIAMLKGVQGTAFLNAQQVDYLAINNLLQQSGGRFQRQAGTNGAYALN